ncbi:hypothetical protein V8B97DRAFT_1875298, partial [Scleroderma yunnanense]
AFALKNLSTFKIPSEVVKDSEMMCTIDSLIKEILTQQKSGMKQKLIASIKSKAHISQLSKSLAPIGHYETTTNHWAQFSFLISNSLLTFNELVDKGVTTVSAKRRKSTMTNEDESVTQAEQNMAIWTWVSTEFLDYIDHLLSDIRVNASREVISELIRNVLNHDFFTTCLQADIKLYPGTISHPAVPAYDKVTIRWHKAIHKELIW